MLHAGVWACVCVCVFCVCGSSLFVIDGLVPYLSPWPSSGVLTPPVRIMPAANTCCHTSKKGREKEERSLMSTRSHIFCCFRSKLKVLSDTFFNATVVGLDVEKSCSTDSFFFFLLLTCLWISLACFNHLFFSSLWFYRAVSWVVPHFQLPICWGLKMNDWPWVSGKCMFLSDFFIALCIPPG